MPYLLSAAAMLVGYLFGAIPFAYVIVRWRKGIDIRTVGSGNVGATNAGRLLGFHYFLMIFGLDLLKGFLPTWGLPRLLDALGYEMPPSLPVFVALSTILGHNYPIYLGFRGGKGVSTSFGALLALDPVACGATISAFIVVLVVTRYVSVSSVLGGVTFAAVHFARVADPFGRRELAMSLLTLVLLTLVILRHRANFARIAKGTEPKVDFRKRSRKATPAGTPPHEDGPPPEPADRPRDPATS